MYNLFIYEKNISKEKKKELEKEKYLKYKKKRKLDLEKLTDNYNKRMDNFIISLCKNPIYLKDLTNKGSSQLIIDEEKSSENKYFQKKKYKNFSLGGYVTEKNRLKILSEKKEIDRQYEEKIIKNKKKQESKLEKNRIKNNKILIQPRMRFKPRNELERISEVMNLLGENKNKKKIANILEQLKQIDLDRIKQTQGFGKLRQLYKKNTKYLQEDKKNEKKEAKNDSMSESSEEDDDDEEELGLDFTLETNLHRKLRNMNLQLEREKKIKNKMLKDRVDNNEDDIEKKIKEKNKKLLELFKDDEKLYFKGASQYVLNKPKMEHMDKKSILNQNDNENFRIMSAMLSPKSVNRCFTPNKLINNKSDNKFYLNNNSNNNIKMFSNKLRRPISMIDLHNGNKIKKKNIYEKDIIKKLDIKFQIKKEIMDKIFNKEIKNSLLKQFYMNLPKRDYGKIFEKPFFLEKNLDISNSPRHIKDENLENKLEYLKEVIKMDFKEEIWNENKSKNKIENNNISNLKKIYTKMKKKEDKNKIKNNEDDIIIDGIKYNNENIRDIADIIFTKCGYYHKKII